MSNDKALLCGINNYKSPSVPDLRGCVNDVESVKRLLVETFGFKTSNIRTLKDAEVTKAEVKTNWSWLVEGAKPGDRLVFHFSGHGSQVPDQDGDEDDDHKDEIFCLYDMDWNDPDTYLLDDEIAAMRHEVPQGTSLTYFFDECHSGSAARLIARQVGGVKQIVALDVNAAQRQMDRHGVRSVDKKKAAEDPADSRSVRVRFLQPPSDFVPPKARPAKSRKAAKAEVKYLSLSACQDEQTAADAFLDGGFHGAFTHSLCRALRDDADQSSKALVERIHAMLQQGGFEQRPASDGEDRAPALGPTTAGGATSTESEETDRGRSERIDDLRSEAADLLEGFVKLLRGRDRPGRRTRATSGRQLVYVHGISSHVEGYSDAWWNSLQPFTSAFGAGTRGDTRHEVLWSNLVNNRDVSVQEQQLRQRIEDVLEDRQRVEAARAIASPRPAGRDMARGDLRRSATLASERGGGLAIDDFLKYMTNDETRRRIIARFVDKVRPLLEDGAEIDVIAHSWGTVVAYEGMREIGGGGPGRVKSFFTAGSALSLPPVRSSLRSENRDGDKPPSVDRWINLDAEGDLVGGALGDQFDVDREELDLVPTGCKRTLFGWGPFPPGCAHSSYFVAENEYVNRVVFAGNIDR